MTKRISQPGADTVSVAKMAAIVADVAVPAAVVTPEPEAGDSKVEAEAAPIAMIAEPEPAAPQDSATTTVTQESTSTTVQDPVTDTQSTTTTSTAVQETTYDDSDDAGVVTDYTPFIVGGVLLAGGILALALSGGDDEDEDETPTPTPPPANTAPTFTSEATATVAENTAATTIVYDANATDAQGDAITYSLGGDDAALFTIDAGTGEVRLNTASNFEADATYNITITATDDDGTPASTSLDVTVTVTDVNEAPSFATATATVSVDENAAADTVVLTAAATDGDAADADNLTYSLTGEDAEAFEIDAETGEVTLADSADFEAEQVYNFNIVATDSGDPGLTATQAVTVNVNDVNEAPTFDEAAATVTVEENVAVDTVVLTGAATDVDGDDVLTYSLTGDDASAFTVDADTGEVRFAASPDFETQATYSFNLVATDADGLTATQTVTVNVTDVEEAVRVELDGGGIPSTTTVEYDASGDEFAFFDNGGEGNFSRIINLEEGDTINVDVAAADYSFSSIGTDLTISLNSNGTVTSIIVEDAVGLTEFVEDEASAEAAVGFDFFQSSVAPPPPPPEDTASIDIGNATPATIGAGDAAYTFSEDAGMINNVIITDFSSDDSIVVKGTSEGQAYSFTSSDDDGDGAADLIISFNNGGTTSYIQIEDVVSSNAFVQDEASAEMATGYDFFSYA